MSTLSSRLAARAQMSRRKTLAVLHSRPTRKRRSPRRGEPGAARPARVGRAAHLGIPAPFAPAPARGTPCDQSPGLGAGLPPACPRRLTTGPAASEARRPPPAPRRPPPLRPAGPRAQFPLATQRRREGGASDRTPSRFPRLLCFLRSGHWLRAPETGRTASLRWDTIGRRRCRSAGGPLAIGRGAAGGLNRSPRRGACCQSATLGPAAA